VLKAAEMVEKGAQMLEADGFVFMPETGPGPQAKKELMHMLAARYRKAKGAKVGPARAAASKTKAPAATPSAGRKLSTPKPKEVAKLQAQYAEDRKISKDLDARLQALKGQMDALERERQMVAQDSVHVRAKLSADTKMKDGSKLFSTKFGATIIADNPLAEGNRGNIWQEEGMTNNFGEATAKAVSHGWTSGADTVHSGGVGMFGDFGIAQCLKHGESGDYECCEDAVKSCGPNPAGLCCAKSTISDGFCDQGEDGGCDLTCMEEEVPGGGPHLSDCQHCPVGTYSGNGYIPSARNILTNDIIPDQPIGAGQCSICPAGKFQGQEGSTGENDAAGCEDCQAGTISGAEAEECDECAAGTYESSLTSCTNCEAGKYAASTGTSGQCQECMAGQHTGGQEGQQGCSQCVAGKYSAAGQGACTNCDAGKSSGAGAPSCDDCMAGTYAGAGAAQCSTCAAGSFAPAVASTCSACPAGTISGSGAASCNPCGTGMFSPWHIRTTLRMTTTHGATEYLVMSTQRHQASDLSTKVCSD
jgi:hypothetical protein